MFPQAYRSHEPFGPNITIDRPIALTGPSSGKFGSVTTTLLSPRSVEFSNLFKILFFLLTILTYSSYSSGYVSHIASQRVVWSTLLIIKFSLKFDLELVLGRTDEGALHLKDQPAAYNKDSTHNLLQHTWSRFVSQ